MINEVILFDFKNFPREILRIGPFSIIVGTNASGKSNIRDAFRVLNGIGCGYTLGEIFAGKFLSGQLIWAPIRGAPDEILRKKDENMLIGAEFNINGDDVLFRIVIDTEVISEEFVIWSEVIRVNGKVLYEWDRFGFKGHSVERNHLATRLIRKDKTVLTQWDEYRDSYYGKEIIKILSEMRFLDPVPGRMREPSLPGQKVLGDNGENLPTVMKALCADEARKKTIIEWVRELTPMDVGDLEFPTDPSGRVHLILREADGRTTSAFAASDGTLRFLAMLAALLAPDPPRIYFFEEIENGIHPSRLRLVVDLIETQTGKGQMQVIATTHSPELLSIVNDETFKHTSVVCRREGTSDSIIQPVSEIANAVELRRSQGLGRLLAGGWMETALAFAEEDEGGAEALE